MSFTHLDDAGNARMVDVTDKQPTVRSATARGFVSCRADVVAALRDGTVPKGDVLAVARDGARVELSDAEIRERMSGNLCRCGAYANIVPAVREAAR